MALALGGKCWNCNELGHTARSCKISHRDDTIQCYYCEQWGHIKRNCPKLSSTPNHQQNHSQEASRDNTPPDTPTVNSYSANGRSLLDTIATSPSHQDDMSTNPLDTPTMNHNESPPRGTLPGTRGYKKSHRGPGGRDIQCYHCRQWGHIKRNCPKLRSTPDHENQRSRKETELKQTNYVDNSQEASRDRITHDTLILQPMPTVNPSSTTNMATTEISSDTPTTSAHDPPDTPTTGATPPKTSPSHQDTSTNSLDIPTTNQATPAGTRVQCYYCGQQGHIKRNCPDLHESSASSRQRHRREPEQGQTKRRKKPRDKNSHTASHSNESAQDLDMPAQPSSSSSQQSIQPTTDLHVSNFQTTPIANLPDTPITQAISPITSQDKSISSLDTSIMSHNESSLLSTSLTSESSQQDESSSSLLDISTDLFSGGKDEKKCGHGYRGDHGYHSHHSSRRKDKDKLFYDRISSLPPFIDTHCHLEYLLSKYRTTDYSSLVKRFQYPANLDGCITSFCDPAAFSSFGCIDELLSEDSVWASFGIHPHHATNYTPQLEEKLLDKLAHPKCVALGEVGLDYSAHSLRQSSRGDQKRVLQDLLKFAPVYDKPVVVHCREAEDDVMEILTACLPYTWKIHLHCYTGTLRIAYQFLDRFPNLVLGFTSHVTYEREFPDLRMLLEGVPLERVLLETDAPYTPPITLKSHYIKWSHPPMAAAVAEEIAKIRGVKCEDVLLTTRDNTRQFYGI